MSDERIEGRQDGPDPRFLGGERAVLTDVSKMALVVAVDWDGAADISAHIDKPQAAKVLRQIADQWDPAVVIPRGDAANLAGPLRNEARMTDRPEWAAVLNTVADLLSGATTEGDEG